MRTYLHSACLSVLLSLVCACRAQAAPEVSEPWPKDRVLANALRRGLSDSSAMDERIDIRSIQEITVGKSESALLVSVWLPDRPRNMSSGVFLYRPRLGQARQLKYGQALGVLYHASVFGKWVVLQNYGSGQGTEEFQNVVVRFDSWDPVVLHEVSFGNNLGMCGVHLGSTECMEDWVEVRLLAQSNPVELIEVTTTLKGPEQAGRSAVVTTRRLRFSGNGFVVVTK